MKRPDTYLYPAVFTYEEGQEIAVVFPDLDVATSGVDEADAMKSAKELLGIVLMGMEEDGEEIPAARSLSELEIESNERSVLVEVYMPTIRYANVNKAVSRTITLPAWLNAMAVEKGVNFSQILQKGLKQEFGIAH
jgi:predicted RNase H-like HicB family nuclease